MWVWLLIPSAAAGFLLGRLLPHRKRVPEPPPMSEEERRALRELQKFLTYDGFDH